MASHMSMVQEKEGRGVMIPYGQSSLAIIQDSFFILDVEEEVCPGYNMDTWLVKHQR